jgi:hypothetical protein
MPHRKARKQRDVFEEIMKSYKSSMILLAIIFSAVMRTQAVAQQNMLNLAVPAATAGEGGQTSALAEPTDDKLHIAFIPYLWFPGMHGTTGVLGYNTYVKASPADLLSHLDIGLMGTVEMNKKNWVVPIDFMWVALSDDHGVPANPTNIQSISFRAGQFIMTPKVGYRVVNTDRFQVDALAGLRYWHLGESLHFNPPLLNGLSTSQNWADAIGGGRIELIMSPKASIVIMGDAGGGGANLDYQVAGVASFKVKKNISLQAGWRYLDVHFQNGNHNFLYDMAESGAVVGATFYFK